MSPDLKEKQSEFNRAMSRYETRGEYIWISRGVATVSIILQVLLLQYALTQDHPTGPLLLSIILAYFFADLVNGLIHLFMDHYENYTAWWGPLVAHFHLHHRTPGYARAPLLKVYFQETQAKLWLPLYLASLGICALMNILPGILCTTLILVGVFSSLAEVVHYLSHTSGSRLFRRLGRLGLVLSKDHHARHHQRDNMNYAFLNGWSDPLINLIARQFFQGYKTTTDPHFASYENRDTKRTEEP